jgi:5-(carboxyamino)imidazole ribonucleotide synthase
MNDQPAIAPGATLGVFGGGQLGRMFAKTAARLGYFVHVFDPLRDCPAAQVAHRHTCAPFGDEDAIRRFARSCDAITVEWENVPVHCLDIAREYAPVRPDGRMLAIAQDRLAERAFLDGLGLETAPHMAVTSADEAAAAAKRIGTPAVLKSARDGYDGRGQVRVDEPADAVRAWKELGVDRALYEGWIEFDLEISVIAARSPRGQIETCGPIENDHCNHILDCSIVPATISSATAQHARELARQIAEATKLEGVICVEMFVLKSGELLINELAPRPHNSGHLTIEACAASQFDQQVRAMCNLPLGDMTVRGGAAMVNLLGDLWNEGEPDWSAAFSHSRAALHLYGKNPPRKGRKMGHLTVLADSADHAQADARAIRRQLADVPGVDASHVVIKSSSGSTIH